MSLVWFTKWPILVICVCAFTEADLTLAMTDTSSGTEDMTDETRIAFVEKHNEFRNDTFPPPSEMLSLVWDYDLEAKAKELADKCNATLSSGEPFNLKSFDDISVDPVTAVTDWKDEKSAYVVGSNSCTAPHQCVHYRQLLVADCRKVGCAYRKCSPNNLIVICVYDKKFNATELVYDFGQPFSCPADTIEEGKLCVPKDPCSVCTDGSDPDDYCICKIMDNKLTTVEVESGTEAVDCGSKSCEHGEELNHNCECYCPDGDIFDTDTRDDDKRNGAVRALLPVAFVYGGVCAMVLFV